MQSLSLVPSKSIAKDPTKLAYLYPRMPVGRYKEQTDTYYRAMTIRAVEEALKPFGAVLIPSKCVHHKRRDPERRIMIYGRTYYTVQADTMTDLEAAKYAIMCGGVDGDADASGI